MEIQIVTINTWKCDGDYDTRMRVLADQLKQLAPHIIACQECFLTKDGKFDTLRFLAEKLDMYYHFTPARFKSRVFKNENVMSYSGLGVLSTYQLKPFAEFDLPFYDADGYRKAQQVSIELSEKGRLLLTNAHLTHLNNATALRKKQLNLISQKTVNKPYDYNIICGDFNAVPNSEEIGFFKAQAKAADCYELGGGKKPRVSMNNSDDKFGVNVDYIFSLPVFQTNIYPAFINSCTVLNMPTNGTYPSDHFGISTTLITD